MSRGLSTSLFQSYSVFGARDSRSVWSPVPFEPTSRVLRQRVMFQMREALAVRSLQFMFLGMNTMEVCSENSCYTNDQMATKVNELFPRR